MYESLSFISAQYICCSSQFGAKWIRSVHNNTRFWIGNDLKIRFSQRAEGRKRSLSFFVFVREIEKDPSFLLKCKSPSTLTSYPHFVLLLFSISGSEPTNQPATLRMELLIASTMLPNHTHTHSLTHLLHRGYKQILSDAKKTLSQPAWVTDFYFHSP